MPDQVFVARERELAQLQPYLDRALAGQGQVCFVTGEAGSGKTALVQELARRAQDAHPDLVVATGNCNAHTGSGDPYLPFREALGLLMGDVETKLAQKAITEENAHRLHAALIRSTEVLIQAGPHLINALVPGSLVIGLVGKAVAEKLGWTEQLAQLARRKEEKPGVAAPAIEQSHIFEQYTQVLRGLAERQPLVLVVDDLHWADAASINLLFHLGRRIEGSRILIVGTYRPEDVALRRGAERHPLESVVNELQRYHADISVKLGQTAQGEDRHFVDAFLDSEPNGLGEGFRQALYARTQGHPLFTIELLRDMQERGDLIRDEDGRWIEGAALDWSALPARVESVIAERIARLDAELQEALAVASVEGEEFTAEVVARVREVSERGLVRRLSAELDKQHRLVRAEGIRRLDTQRLALYRFRHSLFQRYVYNGLDEAERAYLHEDVGNVLEELYGDQVDEIAVQLARHYSEAQVPDKATHYLYLAGERALRIGASLEAVDFFQSALKWAARLRAPDSAPQLARIHERLGDVFLWNLFRHDEVLEHYEAFLELAGSEEERARGTRKVATLHLMRGDLSQAQENFQCALARLSSLAPGEETSRVHCGFAYLLIYRARLDEAAEHARASLEISGRLADTRGLADANKAMGLIVYQRGQLDLAGQHFVWSLELYRELGDLPRIAQACNNVGDCCRRLGRMKQALEHLAEGLEVARRIGDTRDETLLLLTSAEVLLDQGLWDGAIGQLEEVLPLAEDSGMASRIIEVRLILGHAYEAVGRFQDARRHLDLAKALCEEKQLTKFLSRISLGLAHLSVAQGAFDEAQGHIQATLDGAGPDPSDVFLGLVRRCQGDLNRAQGNWREAIQNLEESLRLLEGAKLPAEEGKTRLSLGTAYASRAEEGDAERACQQLLAAQGIFRQIEAVGRLAQVEGQLRQAGCETAN